MHFSKLFSYIYICKPFLIRFLFLRTVRAFWWRWSSCYCTLHKLTLHYTYRIASNSILPELTCRDWVAHPPWGFWSSQLAKAWWWWRWKTRHELRILMSALVVECCLLSLSLGLAPLHPPCTSTLRCKPVHLAHGTVGWKPNPQRTAHLPLQTKHHKMKMANPFAMQCKIMFFLNTLQKN